MHLSSLIAETECGRRAGTLSFGGAKSRRGHICLRDVLGEGAKRPSGGRVWEGVYPPPTVGTFQKLEYKSRVWRAFKNNFIGN